MSLEHDLRQWIRDNRLRAKELETMSDSAGEQSRHSLRNKAAAYRIDADEVEQILNKNEKG